MAAKRSHKDFYAGSSDPFDRLAVIDDDITPLWQRELAGSLLAAMRIYGFFRSVKGKTMRPKITIWSQADCPSCVAVEAWFRREGYDVAVRDIADLPGEPADERNDVMADLQLRDGKLPLVYANGTAMDPDAIAALIGNE